MIRPGLRTDTEVLVRIAETTKVFKPMEIQALREVLDDFHATAHTEGHRLAVLERDHEMAGFVYFAPVAMTDRAWSLWWIVVNKEIQARGIGSELLHYAEEEARRANGRLLFIETSSLPHYDLTRRFYLKHGYEQAAVLNDYYSDGDNLVFFRKRFE
jgi:ribosomal protein S18 acetylase RimI-like enzyme